METITLYAIKSSIVLALLYLPYTLLLRKETFHAFNRVMLLAIVVTSLIVPCLDVPSPIPSSPVGDAISNVVMLPTFVIEAPLSSPEGEAVPPLGEVRWGLWVVLIYLIGMFVFLLWKLVGLVRLVRFIPRGCLWTDNMKEATVYCHAGNVSPFSWMKSIVIGESDVKDAVLAHELAHVRMGHSWDTLLVSLVEVLQWFNPCIWMLDASLREVHEYEADDAVLRRGISARDYQLLLIEKAVAGTRYPMVNALNSECRAMLEWLCRVVPEFRPKVNAFRHSQLKNRITMMTKKKSHSWARLKVLYAVPLTLIALGAFASREIKEMSTPITPKTESIKKQQTKTLKAVPETPRVVVDGEDLTPQETVKAVEGKEISVAYIEHENKAFVSTTSTSDDDKIVEVPEVLAEYPGGQSEMWKWLMINIKYPPMARDWGVSGRVHVQFVVEKDGSITNIKTLPAPAGKGLNEISVMGKSTNAEETTEELERKENEAKARQALEDEAIRVVKAMPKWTPGSVKGQPVRTKFILPISFRLS